MNRGKEVEDHRVTTLRDKNQVLKTLMLDKFDTDFDHPKDYLKNRVKDIIFKNVRA